MVTRTRAALDLRAPPIAVWPGEVVVLAAPDRDALSHVLVAARARASIPVRTLLLDPVPRATAGAAVIASEVRSRRGVVAAVVLAPTESGRRALAALRRAVAREMPCRCLWIAHGRAYPE